MYVIMYATKFSPKYFNGYDEDGNPSFTNKKESATLYNYAPTSLCKLIQAHPSVQGVITLEIV